MQFDSRRAISSAHISINNCYCFRRLGGAVSPGIPGTLRGREKRNAREKGQKAVGALAASRPDAEPEWECELIRASVIRVGYFPERL